MTANRNEADETEQNYIENDQFLKARTDAMMVLCTRRGRFYPDKNYGSRVMEATQPAVALAQAREALAQVNGVYLLNVVDADYGYIFTLLVNGRESQVRVETDEEI